MPIKLSLSNADPLAANVEVLVLGVPEGAPPRSGTLGALSKKIGSAFAKALAREDFTGKRDTCVEIATGDRKPKAEIDRAIVFTTAKASPAAKAELAVGQQIGESVTIARDLINEPPNELYPDALAQAAVAVCKARGLEVKVFDKPALEK